ncbi:MAG: hypothetical protein IKB86_05760 [Clostridia bacterium]|nr:hypothetical protein [Clostridia bacterium]
MMICPETFYEMKLKGKTTAEITTVIRGLKQEIGRLKNIVEHPEYKCTMCPSEDVRISCSRDYLERAKQALVEAGGEYVPSAAEKKVMEFDANIPNIRKVVFSIGGYSCGYETRTYTVVGDTVRIDIEHSLDLKPSNLDECEIEDMDKECFLETLKYLHIGEWRNHYNLKRYGYEILDGTQWDLEIHFNNGKKTVKIYGDNAYPYNFNRALELFEVEGKY